VVWSRHGEHLGASPGEMDGIGAIDPALARDLANAAATNPQTTWCVTVTVTTKDTPPATDAPARTWEPHPPRRTLQRRAARS
jgi:hypothetical protein